MNNNALNGLVGLDKVTRTIICWQSLAELHVKEPLQSTRYPLVGEIVSPVGAKSFQVCALRAPRFLGQLTFALGRPDKLTFFI